LNENSHKATPKMNLSHIDSIVQASLSTLSSCIRPSALTSLQIKIFNK